MNGVRSGYAVTFDGCWFNATPMHEAGHNQGATQYNAPDSTGSGAHCYDEHDVMCYSPDGGDKHQDGTTLFCADKLHYDCGHDTYFDAATEGTEYLASNWNLGSTLNRFVVFANAEGGNTPPVASFNVACNGHACEFDDMSSDPDPNDAVTSWSWDFGDGQTSTEQDPSHTYATAGTYTVTLTVSDGQAQNTATRTIVVDDPNPGTVELSNGVSEFGSTGEPGTWRDYVIRVPRRRDVLRVVLDGPACEYSGGCTSDLDLYVQRNALPELDSWHCRPFQSDSDERCKIFNPRRGRWYVSVYNYAGPAQSPFRVKATYR